MRTKWLLAFCSFAVTPARAEWNAGGSLQGYGQQYTFPSTAEYSSQSGGLAGGLKADYKNSYFKFRSDLEFKADFLTKDDAEKFQGNPRSLYLELGTGSFKLRGGFQTLSLDGPDILNPSDVVNAKNWTDPTSPRALGSAALSLSREWRQWQWEIFYIPVQTKPILPGERSPWWPRENRLPIISDTTEMDIPADVQYRYGNAIELNGATLNNVALKLQRKSESFEGQLLFYEGLAQDPNILVSATARTISVSPREVLLVSSPVTLIPFYYRHQVLAATFTVPRESWAIRGGLSTARPIGDDPRIPGGVSTGVLGVEKGFETKKGLVSLVGQYEGQRRQAYNQISFLKSIFENAVSLGARIPWGEETQFFTGLIYDLTGRSSIFRLQATRRLSDAWTLEAQGQLLQGPSDTLVGLYGKYDSYALALSYHW